jgi:ABC-type Na+ efflux pump permease subunit
MKKLLMIGSALAFGLGVAACDGPKENAAEDAREQQAEVVNDQAESAAASGQISEQQADDATSQAEEKADAMEEKGEAADNASGN